MSGLCIQRSNQHGYRIKLCMDIKNKVVYMKKITMLFALLAVLSLTACHTVHGVGEDLEKASDWTREKLPK